MDIKIGEKIVVTDTPYKTAAPNGTIMKITQDHGDGWIGASVDGGDGFEWCMDPGTWEYAETTDDTPAEPKLWRDMTPAEKGALLLAHHEGKEVQGTRIDIPDDWQCMAIGLSDYAYRVKPEPNVETVTIYTGNPRSEWGPFNDDDDTHRITFNLIDGTPDPASIKMEEL